MPQHFPGLLKRPSEPASGLRVTLVLSGQVLEIEANGASLGLWRFGEIEAARSDGNWFRLDIDGEHWRFLPDTPTEFLFFGVPQISADGERRKSAPRRIRITVPDLLSLGRVALGAVLAVFLVSIGMLMGRYRMDGSGVPVLVALISSAGLGAWWTVVVGRKRHGENVASSKRPAVLRPRTERPVLSVQEVMAAAEKERRAVEDRLDIDVAGGSRFIGHPGTATESGTGDRGDTRTAESDTPSIHTDDEHDGETALEPIPDELAGPDHASEASHEFTDLDSDSADRVSRERDEPIDTPEAEDEGTPPDELVLTSNPSISVADLLDQTADVAEQTTLVVDLTDRPEDAPPIGLTAIRGIGPTISSALTQLGVTDVRDLAVLTEDDLTYLESRLGRFASRTRTREWIDQAQRIVTAEDGHAAI